MARPAQVDSKVVRGKAAFHTLLPALAFLLDSVVPPAGKALVGLTAAAMVASALGGPKVSLFGRLYVQVLRRLLHLSPGRMEDATPHRFAETLGAIFLSAATVTFALRAGSVGWVLALLVSALAALNWLGGICIGCQMYLLLKRVSARGRVA
ncbi:MAG: DUF4395 domain-containing protein [Actinomycetota bacterium]